MILKYELEITSKEAVVAYFKALSVPDFGITDANLK
jgi:hypothetical protein